MSSLGFLYIVTRPALECIVPLFECLKHFQPEDVWITGYLSDYCNVSRKYLPGSYHPFVNWELKKVNSKEYDREILIKVLSNIYDNNNLSNIRGQIPNNNNKYCYASKVWFDEQLATRSLHVNGVHKSLNANELRSLWRRGITSEQLYIDSLLHTKSKLEKNFLQLLELHANRVLRPINISKNKQGTWKNIEGYV